MKFHAEEPDWIIYIGEDKCDSIYSQDCHTEAFYSKDGGKSWNPLTTYVRSCLWGRDVRFKTKDKDTIFCQQYYEKSGNQMMFGLSNPLQFVSTPDYYSSKKVLFDYIVGVAIFEQYMIIAEVGRPSYPIIWSITKEPHSNKKKTPLFYNNFIIACRQRF